MFIQFDWLKFKNVRSYPNTETKIDFTKGLTLITGTNGVGKTSMMEALTYNLYGKPYTKIKINELINRDNKKGLYTECQFTIGNDVYNIIRGLKPSILEIKKNGDNLELLSTKSLSQDDIDKILGVDYKMFKNVISLSASNKPFLDKDTSKAERREIIENIFNINIFADMLKILKKDINVLKTEVEIESSNIKILEETISTERQRINEIKTAKDGFQETKDKDIKQLNDNIERYTKDIFVYKEEIIEYKEKIESEKKKLNEKIKQITKDIGVEETEVQQKIKDYKESSDIKLKEYDDEIKNINDSILVKNKNITKIQSEIKDAEKLYTDKVAKIETEYDKIVLELEEKIKSFDTTKKSKLMSEKDEIRVTQTFLQEKIKENDKMIIFYENNDVCSQCKHEIVEEEKKSLIIKLNESSDDCRAQIETKNEELTAVNIKLSKVEEELEKRKNYQSKLESAEDIKDTQILKLRSTKRDTIDTLNTKLRENDVEVLEHKVSELITTKLNHNSSVEDKLESISNASNVRSLKDRLESLKETDIETSYNNQIKTIKDSILNIKSNIIENKEKIEEIENREFDIDVDTIESEFKVKVKKYKVKYEEYKKDTDRILVYNLTKDILSDGGIKTFFFKKLIPILNQKINIYLDKFSLPISLVFDDEMNVSISSLGGRDKDINYNSFSGGERKRIDMSILFSFIDVTKVISNWNSNIIVADEVADSGIDSDGLSSLLGSIREMVDKTKNLGFYLVSHKIGDEHLGFFSSTWKVEKENQFSKLIIE